MKALILLLPLVFLACSADDEPQRSLTLQVAGNVNTAAVTWRVQGNTMFEQEASLPWTLDVQAPEGDRVFLSVASSDPGAGLWLRILEEGEEVLVVPGCLCNGSYVSAQAEGRVGAWQ